MRKRPPAVGSHDLEALRPAWLRTRVVRLVLAVTTVALLAAGAASARGADPHVRSIIPTGSTGVIVLDLSLSIEDADYRLLRGALRHLIAADAPIGLVVFSDAPYELLPPGTPAHELEPILRLLVPGPHGKPPVNPWSDAFRAGTRISAAIELAKSMLERDRVKHGSVVLMTDLETAPEDLEDMIRALRDLRASSIPVRIVPLSAGREALATVTSVLGPSAFAPPSAFESDRSGRIRSERRGVLPAVLIVLGALSLLTLGAHERLAGRLALPRTREVAA
jgi:hypothetical protein